jgi:transcriptional regulator with XRE-family HTH domain
MDITKSRIGERIKGLREGANKSQEELAGFLGISRGAVTQLEAGRRDLTSIELGKISECFGVPSDYLLSGEIKSQQVFCEANYPELNERVSIPKLKRNKFKEVLLYLLEKTAGKPNVGQTVLYKLLYFIDFNYYEKFEEQLTGVKYIKNHYGPTPVAFTAIVGEMKEKGEVGVDCNKYHGREQTRYIALRKADLRQINGAEKEVIDDVIQKLSDMNATQISDYSHDDTPWAIAQDNEQINYEAVFYRSPQYSVRDYGEL